jgi:hypothetical protein
MLLKPENDNRTSAFGSRFEHFELQKHPEAFFLHCLTVQPEGNKKPWVLCMCTTHSVHAYNALTVHIENDGVNLFHFS